jgi:hypothetical protein
MRRKKGRERRAKVGWREEENQSRHQSYQMWHGGEASVCSLGPLGDRHPAWPIPVAGVSTPFSLHDPRLG